jgi:hypothetical protein
MSSAQRMVESAAINKSLFVLGNVLMALNRKESRIPFRDSKMTRMLQARAGPGRWRRAARLSLRVAQDSLGGNNLTLMVCNVAPGRRFQLFTARTLAFGTLGATVVNRPVASVGGRAAAQSTRPPARAAEHGHAAEAVAKQASPETSPSGEDVRREQLERWRAKREMGKAPQRVAVGGAAPTPPSTLGPAIAAAAPAPRCETL